MSLVDFSVNRKPPAVESDCIPILSVSPSAEDYNTLQQLLHPPRWSVRRADTIESAFALLKQNSSPLVLCEAHVGSSTWRELLARLRSLSNPPLLIVTSRLADDYLWAEALNLGAYDVLAKPFDPTELNRTLTSAWLRWRHRHILAEQQRQKQAATA